MHWLLTVPAAVPEEINFGMLAIRMVVFLGIVLVLIYLILRKGLPLLVQGRAFRKSAVRIVERIPVDQKRSLLVVEIQDRAFLLGSAEGQINVLMELDREKLRPVPAPKENPSGFEEVLKKAIWKPKSSEPSS